MAFEAAIAASAAILKRRYQAGVAKTQFENFPVFDEIEKDETWTGDDNALALQGEDPQGVGTTVANAQAAGEQGVYVRFVITRKEYFALARIKGQALRAAKGEGAVVDLWQNELNGIERTFLKQMEVITMGTGNGVLGTVSAGAAGTGWTLSVAEDVNALAIGMKVKLVSDTTLTPTVRVTTVTITAVGRAAGTVTVSGAVAGGTNGDSIVRAGDEALAGAASVMTGWRQWLIGGTTPGTLAGLNRNPDPVRYASQSLDMTGLPMAEAIIDLESLITIQGKTPKKKLIVNPRDFRQVKKTMFGKAMINGGTGGSTTIGFNTAKWAGDGGEIDVLQSPFCPKANVFLKDMSTFKLYSAGCAPMLLDFDKLNMIRMATDDAYETRFGVYGEFGDRSPVHSARGTNWGV
ncbi:MAG: hypothetical protein ACRCU1_11550 [Alsobacter sp.]